MDEPFTIVALGEVLWDVFPDGPRFGGAPANVACHAAALGADAWMVSQVGKDELGNKAIHALQDRGVHADCVSRARDYPTGTVQVALDESGKPQFTISEGSAWDFLSWSDSLSQLAGQCNAVVFGTLGQRSAASRDVIQQFVAETPADTLRVLDINLRPPFFNDAVINQSLQAASILKLSDDELDTVAASCGVAGGEEEVIAALMKRSQLRLIALTRGSRGATLISPTERSDAEGVPVQVQDTVGAGDAFTAALILGLLRGRPLDDINQHASRVAAYVCSQSGAAPPLPDELRAP
jgi:fructokinase